MTSPPGDGGALSSHESATTRRAALRQEHVARVNRVLDHVENHLCDDLSLAALAEVAGFSPYHFHRVFTSVSGETPGDFISRVRVERAAAELLVQPTAPITRIALECGFSGPAVFARAFRAAFGMSATAWREGGHLRWKQDREAAGRTGYGVLSEDLDPVTRQPVWRIRLADQEPVTVALRHLRPMTIAYLRHVGPYQGDGELFSRLFGRLRRWAAPRGLLADERGWWISVYHDPMVTADDRLRVTVGLTVPPDTPTSGSIASMTIDGGHYAVGRFRLRDDEYARAWDAMMVGWLPESGFRLDDRHCFERCSLGDRGDGEGRTTVEICLPVTPS